MLMILLVLKNLSATASLLSPLQWTVIYQLMLTCSQVTLKIVPVAPYSFWELSWEGCQWQDSLSLSIGYQEIPWSPTCWIQEWVRNLSRKWLQEKLLVDFLFQNVVERTACFFWLLKMFWLYSGNSLHSGLMHSVRGSVFADLITVDPAGDRDTEYSIHCRGSRSVQTNMVCSSQVSRVTTCVSLYPLVWWPLSMEVRIAKAWMSRYFYLVGDHMPHSNQPYFQVVTIMQQVHSFKVMTG